jgi:Tol biopolymer transport system component/DNA-binding winged helix-turn-helix (wHTH) protein
MSLENQNFAFGEFMLDPDEMVLTHHEKPIRVTPKALHLLLILVKNHGHIVNKAQLLDSVWADSFVEEGNLAFTVNQLRKILGDSAQQPKYVQTVPRRGYRFVASVTRVPAAVDVRADDQTAQHGRTQTNSVGPVQRYVYPAIMVMVVAAVAVGAYFIGNPFVGPASVLTTAFGSEKLSTTGRVYHAVVSPDGKNVFYTNVHGERQSVWLRQLDTANNVEIIPPTDDFYHGLATSPSGDILYFVRRPLRDDGQADIYRVSVLGGAPVKIVSNTQGWISVSADGRMLSFVRCEHRDDENCSLWIANAEDGQNERKLVSRPKPLRISNNHISPDGNSVVFAVGQSENAANEFGISVASIANGSERSITGDAFFNVNGLSWMPDGKKILISASRIPNQTFRVWQASLDSGEVVPITKDAESYGELSLDLSASRLVTVTAKADFHLALFRIGEPAAQRVLTDASKVEFTHEGQLLLSSSMSGNQEIWSMRSDGSGARQLTNDPADDTDPILSADSKTIYFASNRSGVRHVWRMNADVSGQSQLTQKEGGFPISATPDGKWLYFHHGVTRALWRIPADGGNEEMVLEMAKYRWAISPDGTRAAFATRESGDLSITSFSIDQKRIIGSIRVGNNDEKLMELAWLPDNSGIAYILADNAFRHNQLWIHSIAESRSRLAADLGDDQIEHLKISPDGTEFAVIQGQWRHDALLITGLR